MICITEPSECDLSHGRCNFDSICSSVGLLWSCGTGCPVHSLSDAGTACCAYELEHEFSLGF